jgi:hypothetical protein
MKQSTRKANALSLVPSAPGPSDSHEQAKEEALNASFEGWLNSVAPTLLQSTITDKPEPVPVYRARRSLTTTDIVSVNRATVRESTDHRHWPPDVVISFLEADVIKRPRGQ